MRCLYVDLDGTLLGPNASLLTGAGGGFSLLGVRALEACARAGAEVVIYSGRKQSSVFEAARLIGSSAYIFELGCGLVLDGELEWLTDGLVPSAEAGSIYDQIEASGAPALLLDRFAGQLEYHTPWSMQPRCVASVPRRRRPGPGQRDACRRVASARCDSSTTASSVPPTSRCRASP